MRTARTSPVEDAKREVIKTCGCCGATSDAAAWSRIRLVGYIRDEGLVLELRQCPCLSSIGVLHARG